MLRVAPQPASSRSLSPPRRVATSAAPTPRAAEPLEGSPRATQWGVHWEIDYPLPRLWSDAETMVSRWKERYAGDPGDTEHPELLALRRFLPGDAILLDLETCGLGSSMVFLAGVVLADDCGRLLLKQLLARDYSEERSLLHGLWEVCCGRQVLVTFNGKSFDWPVVQDRSTLHRLGRRVAGAQAQQAPRGPADARPELTHCDLLHHCRRKWKSRLPNCKLQTLETYICGRRRSGDIPGRLIPRVYHDYVRSGDPGQLRRVLRHNALDLITLLQLAVTL